MAKYSPISVEYIDHMGSDLSVANAARVSLAKVSEWEYSANGRGIKNFLPSLKNNDAKLIHFLAREGHWTPFGHCFLSVRIKLPIFLARQFGKHQVGLVLNEVSRRYVSDEPEFWLPETWRARAPNKKQGSLATGIPANDNAEVSGAYQRVTQDALEVYTEALARGVCPEQARMILPQNMMTEWIWSGSLMAFLRVIGLRLKPDSQEECKLVAEPLRKLVAAYFPISLDAHCGTVLTSLPEAQAA